MNLLRIVNIGSQLIAVYIILCLTQSSIQAQSTQKSDSIQALATITEMNGLVEVRRGQDIFWSKAPHRVMLYPTDVVRVSENGYAVIVFPDRSQVLQGSDSLTIQQQTSIQKNISKRPPLFSAFWRTILRIRGKQTQNLSESRDANWRGKSTLIVPVIPARDSIYQIEPFFAWHPPFYSPEKYQVSLYEAVDGETCWKGGDLVWDIAVQDTFTWYPKNEPTLRPGTRYRLEIKAGPPSKAGFQCFILMDEAARSALSAKIQQGANQTYSITDEILHASMLIDEAYYSDAMTLLQRILMRDPDNQVALELRVYVLDQLNSALK